MFARRLPIVARTKVRRSRRGAAKSASAPVWRGVGVIPGGAGLGGGGVMLPVAAPFSTEHAGPGHNMAVASDTGGASVPCDVPPISSLVGPGRGWRLPRPGLGG